jgi:hypothetical protein
LMRSFGVAVYHVAILRVKGRLLLLLDPCHGICYHARGCRPERLLSQ